MTDTYAGARAVLDADSHIMESPDWLISYVAPLYRERFAALDLSSAGELGRRAEAMFAQITSEHDPLKLEEDVIGGPKGWAALGAWDPAERSRALDLLGFGAQLVFPTFSTLQYLGSRDREIVREGALAQNRGLAEFCESDERLLPVAFVPTRDVSDAVEVLDAALAACCAAVWLPTGPPGGTSPAHPAMDPLWSRLQDSGVPFVLHVGGGKDTLHPRFHDNGRPIPPDHLGGGENVRAKDYPQLHHRAANYLSCMLLDGVFEHFPHLRCGLIELGAAWVPGFLQGVDHAAASFGRSEPMLEALSLTPSEYVHRQVRFTPFPFEDAGWLVDQCGADLFMFSSDYPHPEGTRDPLGRFEASLDKWDIDVAARDRFYTHNFADLVGRDIA
ncbi:MAG: amidohydrolase family protein [Acidimicrobiia bacterium]|nr:amidohydrolase family protein [Acidimicrobiia bacterium]